MADEFKNLVVTVVLTPGDDEKTEVQATVNLNGRVVEGVDVAMLLTGPLTATIISGLKTTGALRSMVRGANGLSDALLDTLFGAFEEAVRPPPEPTDV